MMVNLFEIAYFISGTDAVPFCNVYKDEDYESNQSCIDECCYYYEVIDSDTTSE